MRLIFIFFVFVFSFFHGFSQIPTPAKNQSTPVALWGGTVHVGNGEVIENAVVGFDEGKITHIGSNAYTIDTTRYKTILHCEGKHIYPGLIAPNSSLGLVEIEAVRATLDHIETGSFLPHVRSIIAYNTESKVTPTVRSNGVLMAQIAPRGGIMSGTSSVVELDAWNWEDAVYKMDDALFLNWPSSLNRSHTDNTYKVEATEISDFFEKARAYSELKTPERTDIRFEAMRGLFNGSKTLFVRTYYVKDILDVINFYKKMALTRLVLVGASDAWMITDVLKNNEIAVVLDRTHRLPEKAEDDIDLPYKTPSILHKAGILFCLSSEGDMEQMSTRNLAFYAGTAAAYGLSKEEALASVTLNAAKILGISSTVGSLEVGKDATLIVSEGDLLDMRSSHVEHAFIRGKEIDLDNHQKQLYTKYKSK